MPGPFALQAANGDVSSSNACFRHTCRKHRLEKLIFKIRQLLKISVEYVDILTLFRMVILDRAHDMQLMKIMPNEDPSARGRKR